MAMREEAAAAGELWDEIITLADSLDEGDWSRPSPCPRWSVKDVLAHMSGLQTQFDNSAPQPSPPDGWAPPADLGPLDAWTEAGVVARRSWSREQVREELVLARAGNIATLEAADPDATAVGPTGPTTMRGLYGVRMFDLWTHVQDIAMATGRPVDTAGNSTAARDGGRYLFGAVPVLAAKRAGLTEGRRLRIVLTGDDGFDGVLAVTGGRAAWSDEPSATEPDGEVRAAPGAFTLLLAGRRSPEQWRSDGVLTWSGEFGAAFVERARVFAG
jgi:uncharacterized protein (TIGR03083 family)